jgi:hypothetical protein
MQICNGSNKCARKGHNVPITSTPRAVTAESAVLAWAASEGDSLGKPNVTRRQLCLQIPF